MDQTNARLLYEKLDLTYINENMVGKEFENNWLECKEKSRASHGGLDEAEQAYFAKALSGFSNTAGGVLIFGLEARKRDGIDQIQSIKPIQQLKRFESALREYESRAVERPVPGVEYRAIRTGESDEGMLATFIPQSPHVPHRSLKDKDFYLRAGGVFSSLPLTLIEDLLFRRVRPQLNIGFYWQDMNDILVVLKNPGRTTAKWPHIVIRLPAEIDHKPQVLYGDKNSAWALAPEHRGQPGPFLFFTQSTHLILHPGSEIPLVILQVRPIIGIDHRRISFDVYVTAENMVPIEGTIIPAIRQY